MNDELLPIGETAALIGVSVDTIRRWDTEGKLKPTFVSPGKHRYYRKVDIDLFTNDIFLQAKSWASATEPSLPKNEQYCQLKPVFLARLERMQNELRQIPEFAETYSLIVGVAAEIGNNSFDHNLGNWPDIQGNFFAYDLSRRKIALADRGRGILRTLRDVRPSLESHSDALRVAFTEVLTARAPESRGNGLKFVRANVTKKLIFCSGDAQVTVESGSGQMTIGAISPSVQGCVALIEF